MKLENGLTLETYYDQIFNENSSIYNVLTHEEKEYVKPQLIFNTYRKKQKIYYANEKLNGLIYLLEGKVKIAIEGTIGRQQIIRIAQKKEYIGYRAFFTKERTIAAAISLNDNTLTITVPQKVTYELIENNSNFSLAIIQSLAHDLGFSDKRTVSLTQKYMRGRLAESLLYLRKSFGINPNNNSINFYITREDLANFSNMTPANAIRTLSDFAKEGIVELKRKKIIILNLEELERLSKGF